MGCGRLASLRNKNEKLKVFRKSEVGRTNIFPACIVLKLIYITKKLKEWEVKSNQILSGGKKNKNLFGT